MRADFYPDLMNSELWPVDPADRIEIAPLRGEWLRTAVEQPAKDVGVKLEAGLVERIEADAADADAGAEDEDDPLTDVAPAMSKEMHAQFEEERFKSKQLIYGGLVVIGVLIVLSLLW